jgi:4-hydroxy-2-oxoglutarate aldolase
MNLSGIFAALTTPFNADGAVNKVGLRENIQRYNKTPLIGYVANGSTGEAPLLTWTEVEEAWAVIRDAAAPGKLLIAGTAAESTAETIEYTRRAHLMGFDAALVRTPHYYRSQMTDEVLAAHYLRVADAAKIPILAYSIPSCTGITIEASLLERIAKHPNIIGIKDSSGKVERVSQFRAVVPETFQIVVGGASIVREALKRGGVGGILALACALPEHCAELHECVCDADDERAAVLQQRLVSPSSILVGKYGIPGLKYALDLLGYVGGSARLPLPAVSAEAKVEIASVLADFTGSARGRSAVGQTS